MPGRPHAGLGEPVVEPRGGAVAEVGADAPGGSGVSTCSSTNTTPTNASGPASASPRCTAPTSTPMAMANSGGQHAAQRRARAHQAAAQPAVGLRQDGEELPLLARTQVFQHWRSSEGVCRMVAQEWPVYLPVFLVPRRYLFAAVPSMAPAGPTVAAAAGFIIYSDGSWTGGSGIYRRRQCEGCGPDCWLR